MTSAEPRAELRCVIVVPCYNEGSRLRIEAFLNFLGQVDGIRFLFVNDGSRDNTLSLLREMQSGSQGRIQILDLPANAGKAEAVRFGLLSALQQHESLYVGFWDADLATPLNVIPQLLAQADGNERLQMVFGSRVRLLGHEVHRSPVRHYLGRIFASFASMTLRLPIYDTQCGAKVFRATPELAQVLKEPFLSRWIFDVEILARYIALHHGDVSYLCDSVYEFPLPVWRDVGGSKVRPRDLLRAVVDLYHIHRRYLAGRTRLGLNAQVARH